MDQAIDWQSPYFPKIFEQYDRADFAQEFLRRNPDYRAGYSAALQAIGNERRRLLARHARHWGLVFRHRS